MTKDNLFEKATVTGKRQITIPKKVCEFLNIGTGDQVFFKTVDNVVVFETEKEYDTCFACNGTAKIGDKECFICKGTGKTERNITSDIFKLIQMIGLSSRQYGVAIEFMQHGIDEHGNFRCTDLPIIKLKSTEYRTDELLRIQDELQKIVIRQYSPKRIQNDNQYCIPSDDLLKAIMDTLSTECAKKEVYEWFRR